MLNGGGLSLGGLRQPAVNILFHNETADGHAVGGAPSAVLDVDGDGNLGIVHRGEAHEDGVVVALVLGRSRLAAGCEVVAPQGLAGAAEGRCTHALDDVVVGPGGRLRVALLRVERVEGLALHLAHDVGLMVVAAVGDGGAEVGYLERCEQHLALTDGDGDDGQSVPRALVGLVVELCVGNQAPLLAGQVDAELIAEAHRDHVVAPGVHGVLHGAVLRHAGVDHVVEPPAEEAVARGRECGHQRQGRAVAVAAHVQPLEVEAAVAAVGRLWRDDALAEEGQALRRLERRARRVEAHDGAVVERLPDVLAQFDVLLGALAADHQPGVVGGRRHHAEHLAGRGLDGDDGANLALHEPLAEGLQLEVDAQREVLAGLGPAVEGAVHVAALNTAVGVAQQNLHALLAAQLALVAALDAALADVVAGLVVVVVLDVGGRHLGHVAQDVGGVGVLVLPDAAPLDVEAREAVHLLLEHGELLVGELAHENLLGEARVAGVARAVLHGGHAAVELLPGDVERCAELGGVESALGLVHDHHDVVGGLVEHQQLAVAVGDDATRGEVDLLEECV